jgi:hydroxymethylbilane synthase
LNIKIATRRSKLAQIQADTVISMIKESQGIECEKLLIETEGDRKLDVSLDKIGGKGLFVKDIELALIEKRAQAAVHSMKDVPYEIGAIFELAAMPVREDVRDAFISAEGLGFKELPKGARIGTSSNRRSAQLKLLRPDIETVPIRGNVQTRIDKMGREGLDGIILAAAGLKRLGFEHMVKEYFEPSEFVPAVGQGALGIEILAESETAPVFRALDNREVRICVECERSFMRRLNGGCHTSLGAYAFIEGELIHALGIFSVGGRLVKKDITGSKWDYLRLGKELADKILKG